MSDEESFVILGSTPTPSMEAYSSMNDNQNTVSSIVENKNPPSICRSTDSEASWLKKSNKSLGNLVSDKTSIFSNAEWIAKDNSELKSHNNEDASSTSAIGEASKEPSLKSFPSRNESVLPESLADKYLLGKIDANEMKVQVSSMFSSLFGSSSHQEDVLKLQQLIIDHETYKSQLVKMNRKLEYLIDVIQIGKEKYEQEIKELRQEKNVMKKELESEIEVIKIREQMMQKDCDCLLMKISDGRAILNNIGAKIGKLQLQQEDTSIINLDPTEPPLAQNLREFISLSVQRMKELDCKLSEVTAENLEINDMKKVYLDENNCLKVNLTATEELLHQAKTDVNLLKIKEIGNAEKFVYIDKEKDKMKKEIEVLRHQLEVYRADFEMERNARQEIAGQNDQLLTDLKLLKQRNQQFIEKYEKEKVYLDEINCLKVNLTATEELLHQAKTDVNLLKIKEIGNAEKFGYIDKEKDKMKQEIEVLRHQLEVYRADFEMERNARQEIAGQNDQLLTELKLLKQRNQQFIEKYEKEKVYLDEINCLKVNLTATEELLHQAKTDVNLLKIKEIGNAEKFGYIDKEKDKMKQEIEVLRHQLEVYRADFEMERNARQEIAGQNDQLLTDLKLLKQRNQQFIEKYEKRESPPTQTLSTNGRKPRKWGIYMGNP